MAENQYPIRYVAFLDILGFRELITTLTNDATRLSSVRDLLRDIHRPNVDDFRDVFSDSDLRSQSISDAVAISSNATFTGLAHMFVAVHLLAIKLLEAGFFVRGAIAKGRLFHDPDMVFGEGLVRAYQYESTVARYPRIMLPREIVSDVQEYLKDDKFPEIFEGAIRRSKDGPQYLHVLSRFSEIKKRKDSDPGRERLLARLVKVRDHIQRRLDEAVDQPGHFEKVHWFADYWNDVFYGVKGLDLVEGPGLEIHLTVG